MKCKEVQKSLSVYQDGRLNPDQEISLKDHLSGCAACQKEERALSEVRSALKSLESVEPSPDFKARLWERIRQEEELEKNPWMRLMHMRHEQRYLARPAFALTSLILAAWLGTLAALKLMPQDFIYRQYKSPILQWSESTTGDLKSGGFNL